MISVEYISKKGKEMCHSVLIPIGRKIRQAILSEKKREALKAKQARVMPGISRDNDTAGGDLILLQSNNCQSK